MASSSFTGPLGRYSDKTDLLDGGRKRLFSVSKIKFWFVEKEMLYRKIATT
jgi:hypothetical protein